ncbi:MAG TPA: histidine phosphatase family protein [Saprospiraceae bacterium]|nr:histidine phosphatase family protein [Saprospiraceae bacterium]
MLTLYLIRHAKSSWEHPGLRDINRPLNERGTHDAPKMARLLEQTGVQPDLLVSSTAKRAYQTALYFAAAFGVDDEAVEQNPEIYEAMPTDILRVVSRLPARAQTVFLFGHNPTLTEITNRFSETFIANVPTCGIVKIESSATDWAHFDESNARVTASYFPKEVL